MPSITIEGIPKPVNVDDNFRSMSPEEQGRMVDHIIAVYQAGHRGAGMWYPDRDNPVTRAPADTSFSSALRHGLDNETEGLATTARRLGATDTAQGLSTAVDAARNYQAATPELVEALRSIDIRRAAGLLPRAIAEQAPGLAGTLAAGSAGALAGSVVPGVGTVAGGLIGAGAYSVGRGLGQNVETSAANNDHAEPTVGDWVRGGATTAVSAALDAFGARGLGGAITGTAAGRLRAALSASGREGATEMGQQVVEDVGTSLGTERGLSVDPAEVAAAGLLGTGTRATLAAPGVARGAVGAAREALSDRALRREVGEMTPNFAASVERVNQAMEERASTTRGDASPTTLLRSMAQELDGDTTRLLRRARQQEWIDADQHGELSDLATTARRLNQDLAEGRTDEDGHASGLARLDAMQDLPTEFRDSLRDLLTDRNTVASALRDGGNSGFLARAGGKLGHGAAVIGGLHAGGPLGAIAAAFTAAPTAARVGSAIGGFLDRRVGARSPLIVRARRLAQEELRRSGAEDPGTIAERAQTMDRLLTDARLTERTALGLATDEAALAREAEGMARKRAEWTKRRVQQGLPVSEEELGGLTDRDRVDLLERFRMEADRASQEADAAARRDAEDLAAQGRADAEQRGREVDAAWTQRDALMRDLPGMIGPAAAMQFAEQAGRRQRLAMAQGTATPAPRQGDLQAPPQPSPGPTPAADATPAPAASTESASDGLVYSSPAMPQGWALGISRFASDHRGIHDLAISDVMGALDRLVERGEVSEEVAGAAREGGRLGRDTMERVTAEALGRYGVDPDRPFAHRGAGGAETNGGTRPVRNAEQYRSAADSYQAAASRIADRAHADGDYALAGLVESFAASTETSFTPAERLREAAELIEASIDPGQRQRREAALQPLLRRYRNAPVD